MIKSISEMLQYLEHNYTSRIAFQWVDEKTEQVCAKNYQEYVSDIRTFAAYLRADFPNVERKHIGILADNSYDYVVALMGILLSNAVAVPLNLRDTLENIEYEINFADLFCIFRDNSDAEIFELPSKYDHMIRSIDEYRKKDCFPLEISPKCNESDMALMLFTSGTTGKSKGVMLSYHNLLSTLNSQLLQYDYRINEMLKTGITREQLEQMPIPSYFLAHRMYHAAGISGLFSFPALGMKLNLCLSIGQIYRDLKLMPSSCAAVVPMVFESFYKDLKKGRFDRLGILHEIICGAAKINPEILECFQKNGYIVAQGYGMTESFATGTIIMYSDLTKINSIGIPSPGCQIKIENNEICLKSDSVMLGYYKDPKATSEVLKDGWLYTGDMGFIDKDGYIYLTGRKKNLIILSSGENVSPEELEQLLAKNNAVLESMVVEKNGKICARIYCEKEAQAGLKDYVTEVNINLPMFKRMTVVEFCTEPFPKTATGKIKRY